MIFVLLLKQVDIELPEELPLKEAHAIGETLQEKLEKLPEVERAFVHLDYECDHKPEHSVLSRLPNNLTWILNSSDNSDMEDVL